MNSETLAPSGMSLPWMPTQNAQVANFVARNIKALLYRLAAGYPNLKYMVLIGDDRMIPARRIVDEALYANERLYPDIPRTTAIGAAEQDRYFLSDDYYAGLLPLPFKGRELYLPQLGIGRLVETPAEIAAQIDAFRQQPTANPTSALVTGYSFLKGQSDQVSSTLRDYGVTDQASLINDTWTAAQFRTTFFGQPKARGLKPFVTLNHYTTDTSVGRQNTLHDCARPQFPAGRLDHRCQRLRKACRATHRIERAVGTLDHATPRAVQIVGRVVKIAGEPSARDCDVALPAGLSFAEARVDGVGGKWGAEQWPSILRRRDRTRERKRAAPEVRGSKGHPRELPRHRPALRSRELGRLELEARKEIGRPTRPSRTPSTAGRWSSWPSRSSYGCGSRPW